MRSVLTVFEELPWPIAGGWILFLAWTAFQLAWYRLARVAPPLVAQASAPARTIAARAARKKQADTTNVDMLPPIDLDSMRSSDIAAPSQSVLGL